MQRADELLQRFKTYRIPNFPFVVIPKDIDAATLRSKTPVIFLSVMIVCLEDEFLLQTQLAERFKAAICDDLIMNNMKSLELLQGLLVYLGWCQYQCQQKQQIYLFRHMAWALASDLALDRHPGKGQSRDSHSCMKVQPIIPYSGLVAVDSEPESWTAARQRAFLGCYYLNNASATFRRQMSGMKHTK